jgi:hypothetical protein
MIAALAFPVSQNGKMDRPSLLARLENCIDFEISARPRRHMTRDRFIQDSGCHPPPAVLECLEIHQIKCVVLLSGEIQFAALPALFHPPGHSQ